MKITRHAVSRIRQRVGIRKKEKAKQLAREAWKNGKPIDDVPQNVQEFIEENCKGAQALIYKNFLYLFRGQTLITVFGLPNEVVKQAAKEEQEKLENYKKELETELAYLLHTRQQAIEETVHYLDILKCPECSADLNEIIYDDENKIQFECDKGCFRTKKATTLEEIKLASKKTRKKLFENKIKKVRKRLLNI